ncbi:MAG: ABC transporter ATP-binding protein [Oscillospiraceae bacterium]|nr:ABC transporter ATP-binding protein [Oscillospiraceae bacterium]
MSIELDHVSFSYPRRTVLDDVSFTAGKGELIALLGPNGAGKSTLFRCMLGFLRCGGSISIDGRGIRSFTRAEAARELAYIPQAVSPVFNYTVLDTVLMGVTGRLSLAEMPGEEHRRTAMDILDSLGIAGLADRGCGQISGGERQLTLLARALIQNAGILIMDEPTANLDYGNQHRVMERISALSARGYTVIFSTHDPNQALMHASRVLVLSDGRIMTDGSPASSLTEETLSSLYGIPVSRRRVDTENGGTLICFPGK